MEYQLAKPRYNIQSRRIRNPNTEKKKKKIKTDLMEVANMSPLITSLSSRALNVNGNIWDHIRLGNFKIPSSFFINTHQTRPRCTLTVQQPDVRCDVKSTPQSLD